MAQVKMSVIVFFALSTVSEISCQLLYIQPGFDKTNSLMELYQNETTERELSHHEEVKTIMQNQQDTLTQLAETQGQTLGNVTQMTATQHQMLLAQTETQSTLNSSSQTQIETLAAQTESQRTLSGMSQTQTEILDILNSSSQTQTEMLAAQTQTQSTLYSMSQTQIQTRATQTETQRTLNASSQTQTQILAAQNETQRTLFASSQTQTEMLAAQTETQRTLNAMSQTQTEILAEQTETQQTLTDINQTQTRLLAAHTQTLDTLNEISQTQRQMSNTLSIVATLLQTQTQQQRNMSDTMDTVVSVLQTQQKTLENISYSLDQQANQRDCLDLLSMQLSSGIYTIHPDRSLYRVYCDMETDGGGWTVFQRRFDGSVDFYRNWANYLQGFGSLDGEFWLGLERLHLLTNRSGQSWELMIKLEDFINDTVYARYGSFSVGNEASNYTLRIGSYSGTAGDALEYHNNQPFSTHDRDHDVSSVNCAQSRQGAWWYMNCAYSNLNGRYLGETGDSLQGMAWYHWKSLQSLKASTMMMRPIM